MFKDLDPLIHSQVRLAIMSTLMSVEEADFLYLKEVSKAAAGNLSVQLTNLSDAGYITVKKGFKGKRTRTTCQITQKGKLAFEAYVKALKSYL